MLHKATVFNDWYQSKGGECVNELNPVDALRGQCHSAQGVETAGHMVEYVAAAQQELAQKEETVTAKLDEARAAILSAVQAGTVDDETLESLRSDWAHADFYKRYVRGSAEDNGEKIAHNPAAMHEYLDHAIELLDGILAAL